MKKTVLIVDDSETVRQHVSRSLIGAGFGTIEAADGVEGLVRALTEDVSLVLLDVNMPRLNGLDMLDRMREDPKGAALPVLMLTTEAQPSMIERAKKAGAKGWMIKPVKPELLVSAVSRLTR